MENHPKLRASLRVQRANNKQRPDRYSRQAISSNLHFRQIDASNFTVRQFGDNNNGRFFAVLAAMFCFLSRQTNGSSNKKTKPQRSGRPKGTVFLARLQLADRDQQVEGADTRTQSSLPLRLVEPERTFGASGANRAKSGGVCGANRRNRATTQCPGIN